MPEAGVRAAVDGDAATIAALMCVDPCGLGGVALRARAGPGRDAWLEGVQALMPVAAPWRRVPLHVQDDRLLGGLDLAATLRAGRPVAQRGLLAEADGGIVVLGMAERIAPGTAARIAAVLDTHEVLMARDGFAARMPSRIGVIALDEGLADDERLPDKLQERLAFHLSLEPVIPQRAVGELLIWSLDDVLAARALLPAVQVDGTLQRALCAAAMALGVDSMRASLLAVRAAQAAAALAGRIEVEESDVALAARLVLLPRATTVLAGPEQAAAPPEEEPGQTEASKEPESAGDAPAELPAKVEEALDDTVREAAVAVIPAGLLDELKAAQLGRALKSSAGRAGIQACGSLRGRPSGVRPGEPRGGARLNLIATLRAAAPWQPLRRREAAGADDAQLRIRIRREDFHVTHFKQRSETTTIFVVDASGSSALHRLAEAKGAVELLLADCYVRRDNVALIAFRGRGAELLLPPTRSLVRAKRSLAGLPGGGGTPLAAGLDAALTVASAIARRGATPLAVLLTDGRANIGRDGTPGRERALADALRSAAQLRTAGVPALLLDTAPQPQASARALADRMGAAYLPLPHADAARLSRVVRAAAVSGSVAR